MKKIAILILLLLMCKSIFAQEKRAKKTEIPDKMTDFIKKTYPNHSKLKFYKELKNDTLHFESTFCSNKNEYTLSFDKIGNLEEIEVTLSFEKIPVEIKQKIKNYLKNNFLTFKIKKTQEVDLKGVLLYEFAIKAKRKTEKKTTEKGFYEIYFDRNGDFIKIGILKLNTIQSLF